MPFPPSLTNQRLGACVPMPRENVTAFSPSHSLMLFPLMDLLAIGDPCPASIVIREKSSASIFHIAPFVSRTYTPPLSATENRCSLPATVARTSSRAASSPSTNEIPEGSATESALAQSPSRKSVPPPSATAIVPLKSDATESVPPSRTNLPTVMADTDFRVDDEYSRVPLFTVTISMVPPALSDAILQPPLSYTRFLTVAFAESLRLPVSVTSPFTST